MTTVTFDTTYISSGITLSNSNKTATVTSWPAGADNACAVTSDNWQTDGGYFETVFTTIGPPNAGQAVQVGIKQFWASMDARLANGGFSFYAYGWVEGPAGWVDLGAPWGVNDVIGVRVQATQVDLYINGTHVGTVASSPDTDTRGAIALAGIGDVATSNFGASTMAYRPSGVTSWDGSQSGASVSPRTAVVDQTLGSPAQTATDTVNNRLAVTQTLGALAQAVTAVSSATRTLSSSQVLAAIGQSATGSSLDPRNISVAQALAAINQAATIQANIPAAAAVAQAMWMVQQAATATSPTVVTPPVPTINPVGTIKGITIAGTGASNSDPIIWPSALITASDVMFARRSMSKSGGPSTTGIEQVVQSGLDFWEAQIGIKIRKKEHVLAYRAMMARANGRASSWLIPTCSRYPPLATETGTGPSGGAFSFGFSSGFQIGVAGIFPTIDNVVTNATTALATGAGVLRARALNIKMAHSYEVPAIGQYFSIGSKLYLIGTVTLINADQGTYRITFSPGLRFQANPSTQLDFVNTRCLMRLADDNIGQMNLESLRFADIQLRFVEIPA